MRIKITLFALVIAGLTWLGLATQPPAGHQPAARHVTHQCQSITHDHETWTECRYSDGRITSTLTATRP